jgi:DNA-binding NtrC family response regulator
MNVELKGFMPTATRRLIRFPWPGNNRQLENVVRELIAVVRGKSKTEEHPFVRI